MACSWLQKILLSLLLTAVVVLCQRGRDPSSYNLCDCPGRSDSDKVCRCVYITRCNKTGYVLRGTEIIVDNRAGGGPVKCKGAEKCCIVPESKTTTETPTTKSTKTPTTKSTKTPTTKRTRTPTTKSTKTPTTKRTKTPTTKSTKTPTTKRTKTPTTKSTESTTSTTLRITEETPVVLPTMVDARCGCGIRRPGQKNSDGDLSTSFGEFPWIVNIVQIPTKGAMKKCGGSLISHNAVVTAAHCVHKLSINQVAVHAGDWDLVSKREPLPSYDRKVTKIIIHEDFNADSLVNDIALLIVDNPLPHQPHIDTICLPEHGATFDGKRCTVAGWGARKTAMEGEDMESSGDISTDDDLSDAGMTIARNLKECCKRNKLDTKLTKFDVPVIEKIRCQDMLRKTDFKFDKSFMCAGGEETGTCTGDGGYPLMCESKYSDRYYLAGIVASGLSCGEKNIPDVYADVGQHRKWINTQLTYNSIVNEADYP